MLKVICACLSLLLLASCAEEPGGIIVMNEETIENFFEKDKQSWNPPAHLNLLIDQPVTEAKLPPIAPENVRLYGTLDSDGPYVFKSASHVIKNRGSSFTRSVFGKLGPAGYAGNAWFYADFNTQTGQIADARAYIYGFMGGVCDMRQKTEGSFGEIGESGLTLTINGPCLFPDLPGATIDYLLLVEGKKPNSAQTYNLHYVIDNTPALRDIPQSPQKSPEIYDAGSGKAWLK